ncbi:hypothetical protein ACR79S_12390 [Sphingobacterium spiritivorum]|uniref:hypothetical protein n=1 Tax=Sphingobacterium spiritivorum TaxID=258 RepID=UPI003DA2E198
MKKKLNEKQETEAKFLKDWSIVVIDFICSKYSEQTFFGEMFKEAFSEETKQRYLKELNPSIYLKGLRMAFNDVNEMALDGTPAMHEELNKVLRSKFGKDLMTYSKNIHKKITQIIGKGEISNENEYRLIMSYIDSIYNIESKQDELSKLNLLLATYEK